MKKKADSKFYGIFGFPLSHTLSPAMQEAAFANLGIKAYYLVLEFRSDHFGKVVRQLSETLLEGFNVTVPYKEKIMRYLDELTPQARNIGAVNTVCRRGRRWLGTNTDVDGFLISLKEDGRFNFRNKKALVLGAGGGARAVVYGLAKGGIHEIRITDLYREKVAKIIKDFKPLFPKTTFVGIASDPKKLKEAFCGADLVINATAVGLKPGDPSLIPASWVPKANPDRRMLFYDLVYRPAQTRFLKIAKSKGHRAVNGLGMLLHQGALAFEWWTGKKAPVRAMRHALENALGLN